METTSTTPRKTPDYITLVNMPKITEQRAELAAALSQAQAEIEAAPKTESNPFFKSSYADLATVRAAIRDAFGKHGLSVIQIPHTADDRVLVTTILMHKSGQFVEGTLAMRPLKNDPQAIGSAITYARRYSLMAFAGVAPDDDDGNAASQPLSPPPKKQQPQKPRDTTAEAIAILKAELHNAGADDAHQANAILKMSQGSLDIDLTKVQSKGLAETLTKAVQKLRETYPQNLARIAEIWRLAVENGYDPKQDSLHRLVMFVTQDANGKLEEAVSTANYPEFLEDLKAAVKQYPDSLMGEVNKFHEKVKKEYR